MSALQVFSYLNTHIRIQLDASDAPWWVAQDVCNILEYADHRQALSRLDDDEKGYVQVHTPGGMQSMVAVNEDGLYSLILDSKKPEAKKFRKWITKEVIPALIRTGEYTIQDKTLSMTTQMVTLQKQITQLSKAVASLKKSGKGKQVARCIDCHRTISVKDWAVERLRVNKLCNTCCEVRFKAFRNRRKY